MNMNLIINFFKSLPESLDHPSIDLYHKQIQPFDEEERVCHDCQFLKKPFGIQ